MRTSRTLRGLLCLALASLLPGAAGCSAHPAAGTEGGADKAPRAVRVVSPQKCTLARLIEQPARVEAFEQTPIQVKISGYVEKVNVEIGSRVKRGEVLAKLSVPEMDEELKLKTGLVAQARIDITLAEKTFKVSEANFKTTRSLVDEAIASRKRAAASVARWQSESARMEKMFREKVIAAQDRDETLHQYQTAQAALEEAGAHIASAEAAREESQARRDKAEADVGAARNRLLLAQAEERRLAALLRYADITAPFDGVVSQRNVHTGHFLQPASGAAGKAEPVFEVVRMDRVRIFLEVPESDAVLVKCGPKEGCPAKIRVPVLNDREFTGRVSGTSWSLEPGQRTLRTEIDFENPQGLLRPGMYAQALIEAEQPDAWTLPAAAVVTRDGQNYCYLVEDGKAVRIVVRTGARAGAAVEVLKKQRRPARSGERARWVDFTGGETVITGRVDELVDGQAVLAGPG